MPTQQDVNAFQNQLQQFSAEIDIELGLLTKRIVLQIFTGIILKTPVDTGRLESNWGINAGGPASAPSHATNYEKRGTKPSKAAVDAEAQNYAQAAIGVIDGSQAIYITNSLPYASFVENGTDKIPPVHMVARTLAEVQEALSALFEG